MANTWIVNDYEAGEILRFKHKSISGLSALEAYIHYISPQLSEIEVKEAADDFNGEIWAADNIKDITIH